MSKKPEVTETTCHCTPESFTVVLVVMTVVLSSSLMDGGNDGNFRRSILWITQPIVTNTKESHCNRLNRRLNRHYGKKKKVSSSTSMLLILFWYIHS